jgi:peroxiredoxin
MGSEGPHAMISPRCTAQLGLTAALSLFVVAMATIFLRPLFAQRPIAFAEPGNPAPYFNLADPEGRTLSSDDLRGSVAILYFTSVHCPDCATYNARVEALAHRYRNDQRVRFVAINLDPNSDPLQVRVDAKIIGRSFPTLLDDKSIAATAYSIKSTPQIAVIAPTGVLRYRGPFDDNAIESQVKERYVADTLASLLNNSELAAAFPTR